MIFRWRCPCALSTFPSTYYGLFFRQTSTGKVLSFCLHISLIGVFMCNFSFVAKDFLTKAEMATQESFNADGEGNADQAHAQDAQIGGSTGPSVWAPAAPRGGHSGTGSGLSARWLQKCWLGACRCALAGGFSPPAPREDSPAPVPVTGLWLLGGRVAWARTSPGGGAGRSSGGAAGPRGASSAPSVHALLRGPSISDSVTPGGWGSFPGVFSSRCKE